MSKIPQNLENDQQTLKLQKWKNNPQLSKITNKPQKRSKYRQFWYAFRLVIKLKKLFRTCIIYVVSKLLDYMIWILDNLHK